MTKQSVTVLGATGSVGTSALQVMAAHPELFEVFALTACLNKEKLLEQCKRYQPKYAVLMNEADGQWLRESLAGDKATTVLTGVEALDWVASAPEVDTVLAAIVGSAGALPTFAAARAGKKILLANKETLVVAGGLFYEQVKKSGALVLPLDSEHSAIFQVLPSDRKQLKRVILTASGGPFLRWELDTLPQATVAHALKHPNWCMGKKISVDSATMMNKALEVIEAYWLFNIDSTQISVVIHPESVIHSLVELIDGSVLAQLSVPDMKVPIAYALAYPERIISGSNALCLEVLAGLHFEGVEEARFPALRLAYEVLAQGLDAGCIFNAANETAVNLFLQGRIKFTSIYRLVSEALNYFELEKHDSLESLLLKEQRVRKEIERRVKHCVKDTI
ncbi:MAG: 1-deoxy-D-xylulose-5-phosphate reductoisomerase [Neisseriaceae bacterium]